MTTSKTKNVNLFNHTVPYFIELALEQCLKEQRRILELAVKSKHSKKYLLLLKKLSDFTIELISWQRGILKKSTPISYFLKKSQKIEKSANELSKNLWQWNGLNIASVFSYALTEKERSKDNFKIMLRTHFDIQRSWLLEQIRGARLLYQNSDLGDDVEKVFFEYLQKNLDNDCLVVRGGHVFDKEGNRSPQMDIIIVQAKTLSICPSDTENGKYNVLIDQVIAAVSVKSTLNVNAFEDAWSGLQSIPSYKEKDNDLPGLKQQNWPLCFIVSANSDNINVLNRKWDELIEAQSQQLELFISLEKGYSIAGNSSWPLHREPNNKGSFTNGKDLQAGLGLGFMLNSILARSAHLANRPLNIYAKQEKLLRHASLQTGSGCPTFSNSKYYREKTFPINKIIQWSWHEEGFSIGKSLTNNISVHSLCINNERLFNPQRPLRKNAKYNGEPYDSRWFEPISMVKKDKVLHLKEWIKDLSGDGYTSRQVKFNLETGEEII